MRPAGASRTLPFMKTPQALVLAIATASLTGCAALLPRGGETEPSRFASYEEAAQFFSSIRPYVTTVSELHDLGLDVRASPNVQRVPYPQWFVSLVGPQAARDATAPGIRDCHAAGQGCEAYVFRFSKVRHERVGNFAADVLNFRRLTKTHGWRFEAVLLVRDGVVLFSNQGGQPSIERVEERRQPLGPLQDAGQALAGRQ